jgi:hypothetical protein
LAVTDAGEDPRAVLAAAGDAIVAGVEQAGPDWAVRQVDRILDAWGRLAPDRRPAVRDDAARAGRAASVRVGAALRNLLAREPTEQTATPLEIVRTLVVEPTAVLQALGVPPVVRDPFDERSHPEDRYDLSPRTLTDLDPALGPELLVWGVAKAKVVRAAGQRGRPGTE